MQMTGLLELLILCSHKIRKRNKCVFADYNIKLGTLALKGSDKKQRTLSNRYIFACFIVLCVPTVIMGEQNMSTELS